MEQDKRITIHICTKDRHSELGFLLQSLQTQSYQNFDIIIYDDASGTPIMNCGFLVALFNRIKLEGHKMKVLRNDMSFGVCKARNTCIEQDHFNNPFTCRLDDDCIPNQNYLSELMAGIYQGYDLVSGCIPLLAVPPFERELKYVLPIINKHEIDSEGNLTKNNDDCGFNYLEKEIIPTHQFRTNALYRSEFHKKFQYPTNLTKVGFREEGFFSFQAILAGYKLAVNTGAIAYHFATPSGGTRCTDYTQCLQIDEQTWKEWIKQKFQQHGNFLENYNQKVVK